MSPPPLKQLSGILKEVGLLQAPWMDTSVGDKVYTAVIAPCIGASDLAEPTTGKVATCWVCKTFNVEAINLPFFQLCLARLTPSHLVRHEVILGVSITHTVGSWK